MKLSTYGKLFIKAFEVKDVDDPPLKSYQDIKKIWTVGFGTTFIDRKRVNSTTHITREEAERHFESDVERFERAVNNMLTVCVTQHQFDALVSIMYNCGEGAKGKADGIVTLKSGEPSTLLRKLNAGDYAGAQAEFLKWNKADGKVVKGLTNRRRAESAMFGNATLGEGDIPSKPLLESRTILTNTAAGVAGAGVVAGESISEVIGVLQGGTAMFSTESIIYTVLGLVVLGLSVYAIYLKIDDRNKTG